MDARTEDILMGVSMNDDMDNTLMMDLDDIMYAMMLGVEIPNE
jgi:hypothetical protein